MRKNSYFLTLAVPSTLPVFHCILFLLSCFLLPLSVFCPIVNTWYSLGLYHRSNQFAHLCLMIFISSSTSTWYFSVILCNAVLPATMVVMLTTYIFAQFKFAHLVFSSAPVQLSCVQTSQLITSLPSQASTVQLKLSSIHLTHHPHYAFAICLPACSAHFALVFHILNASSPKTLSKLNALLMHNTKSMSGESNILFNFLFSQQMGINTRGIILTQGLFKSLDATWVWPLHPSEADIILKISYWSKIINDLLRTPESSIP